MKIKYLFICLMFFVSFQNVNAVETSNDKDIVKLYVFWRDGCGACEALLENLNEIEEEYLDVFEVVTVDVYFGSNGNLYEDISSELGDSGYVPYTVVGRQHISGYDMEAIITAAVEEYNNSEYEDYVGSYAKVSGGYALEDLEHACEIKNINYWNAEEKDVNGFLVASILIIVTSSLAYLVFSPKKM